MAFELRLRDTSPKIGQIAYSGGAGGVSPISPLTSVIQTSSSRPGQGPRFREAENIQGLPARQDPPGPGIRLGGGGGRGGSAGSPIAGAIEAVGNKFARAIRGLPTVMSQKEAAEAYGGGEFGPSPAPVPFSGFTPPITSSFATPASAAAAASPLLFLNEGGFVRKRT